MEGLFTGALVHSLSQNASTGDASPAWVHDVMPLAFCGFSKLTSRSNREYLPTDDRMRIWFR